MKKKAIAIAAAASLTLVSSASVFAAATQISNPASTVTAKITKAQQHADIMQLIQKITDLRKQNLDLDVQLRSIPWKKESYLTAKRNIIAKEGSLVRTEMKKINSLLNTAKKGNNKKAFTQIEGQLKLENNKLLSLGKQFKQVASAYNVDNAKVVKDLKAIAALENQENKNLALFHRASNIKDFAVAKTALREAIATLQQIVNTKQNLLKIKQGLLPVKPVPAPIPAPTPAPVTTGDTITVTPTGDTITVVPTPAPAAQS